MRTIGFMIDRALMAFSGDVRDKDPSACHREDVDGLRGGASSWLCASARCPDS